MCSCESCDISHPNERLDERPNERLDERLDEHPAMIIAMTEYIV